MVQTRPSRAALSVKAGVLTLVAALALGAAAMALRQASPKPPPASVSVQGRSFRDAPATRPAESPAAPPESPGQTGAQLAGEDAAAGDGGVRAITFDFLAQYQYFPGTLLTAEQRSAGGTGRIPAEVTALDGKRVSIRGFMVPDSYPGDGVRTFLLVRNQLMCCFGIPVGMNEWIDVKMSGDRVAKFTPDVLVEVTGELDVGERSDDEGWVISIYRIVADDVTVQSGF